MKIIHYGGLNLNISSGEGHNDNPLLLRCVRSNCFSIAQSLLFHECDVNVTDGFGHNALMRAVIHGKPKFVQYLIQAKINVNHQDNFGCHAAHFAFGNSCSASCFKILLDQNVELDLNAKDEDGLTPLMVAFDDGRSIGGEELDILNLLIEYKADVNAQAYDGQSVLMRYVDDDDDDYLDAVALLVENGCQLNLKNNSRDTAFDILLSNEEESGIFEEKKEQIVKFLITYGCDLGDASNVVTNESGEVIGTPGIAVWEQARQDDSFARISELFEEYMLAPYVSFGKNFFWQQVAYIRRN